MTSLVRPSTALNERPPGCDEPILDKAKGSFEIYCKVLQSLDEAQGVATCGVRLFSTVWPPRLT